MPSSQPSSADKGIWTADYVNEEHIAAFARALSSTDTQIIDGETSPLSPKSPPIPLGSSEHLAGLNDHAGSTGLGRSTSATQTWKYGPDNGAFASRGPGVRRVEKLTATSDFAVRPGPSGAARLDMSKSSSQQGWTYHIIRWPLLFFIFLIIGFEFGAYVLTRQVVNVSEYVLAWRGRKGTLRVELRSAKTYEEWATAAKKLDKYLEFDDWKDLDEDGYFDYHLVKRVRRTLIKLRAAKDSRGLMDALAVCVRSNFAGTEGVKMYSETFIGTKRLVEAHISEVASCLDFVRTASDVSLEEKRAFFRAVNKNYGSSALCLSGGASFGYYHFGVVKAFLEADLLPRVVTGTSAGGLVAALLCTRTDDELKELLVPELANKISACEDPASVWVKRWWQTGARFSAIEWAKKAMFFTYGSLTFKEAYERTGRALNVSVVPSDRHSPTILLNHLTAPNCLIWSAIIASAAVPGILNPVVLMAKDRDGQVKPHNLGGSRFKDGSLREDIPLGSLHTQFNCNFSIVSQTNPHIHLFFFAPRGSVGRPVAHRKGKGWRGGFILSALESYIKLDLSKHFKVIRDLDLLPQILQSDWSGVFLQRFSGDLTLTPRSTIGDWFRLLSDPTVPQLARMLDVGERVSWPALRMVRNRMMIERAIFRGRSEVRAAVHRDRTSNDRGSPVRMSGDATPNQVPIESDADAGFASRSRRLRAQRTAPPTLDLFGNAAEGSRAAMAAMRRRKGAPRAARRRASEVLPDPIAIPEPEPPRPTPQAQARAYATTLGDTFRHVRASSLSAFGNNFSPFRSLRGGQGQAPASPLAQEDTRRKMSSMSISRWFGGVSESSSEVEDDDGDGDGFGGAASLSGRSGDEALFGDSAVVDGGEAESDESEGEGEIPIPGGERVSRGDIDASAASGEGMRSAGGAYSPPQQDKGE